MPMRLDDSEGWSVEIDVPVEFGIRRVSLVPMHDGRLVALDTTGGGTYGVLLLGELTPVDPADTALPRLCRAHDHQGTEVGEGNQITLLERLFNQHPLRHTVMAHGVFQRDNG